MSSDRAPSADALAVKAGGLPARLQHLPFPALLAGLVVYGGLGLGLAALGGWVGLGAVFCLAALMIAGIIAAT